MIIRVWTDASTYPRNPGHMGLAYAAQVDGRLVLGRAYAGYGTSNLAELLAIHFALQVLRVGAHDDVTLYTDSQYSLKLIDGVWRWGAYGWLVRAIRGYGAKIEGLLMDLVRGHRGIEGNEQANWAAYQVAVRGVADPLCPVYVLRDVWAQALEAQVMPALGCFGPARQREITDIHQKVRRGKRNMDEQERAVISAALGSVRLLNRAYQQEACR